MRELLVREKQFALEIIGCLNFTKTVINPQRTGETPSDQIIYASSPITTGKRMYDQFSAHAVNSVDQLKEIDSQLFSEHIFQANLNDGKAFGEELRQEGYGIVITPGEFYRAGWEQEHYMSLWKQVINQYADSVHLNTDWEYSNGCAQEFLIALEMGLPIVERGSKVSLNKEEGIAKIENAIDEIAERGVEPKQLLAIRRDIVVFKPRTNIPLSTRA